MNAIVLVDQHWGIGCGGAQNVFLSADLQRFVQLTRGKPVILGRKTLATFPGGRPLKDRRNLILSAQKDFTVQGAQVFPSFQLLKESLSQEEEEQAFVIGGASVYQALLPHCQQVFVTKVQAEFPADCYFPNLDQDPLWQAVQEGEILEEKGLSFSYWVYNKL